MRQRQGADLCQGFLRTEAEASAQANSGEIPQHSIRHLANTGQKGKHMGLFDWLRGPSDEQIAEEYIRQDCNDTHISALVRHYDVEVTTDIVAQFTGVSLRDEQTAGVVQKLRNEYGLGPIAEHNMPGYVDPDDYPEDQEERRTYLAEREGRNAQVAEEQSRGGGLLGWLFG
jgi:hypothetical protein